MLKAREIKSRSQKDLQDLLKTEWAKLRDLRFRVAGAQLKNTQEVKYTRRQIATILTLLEEKRKK